MAEIVRRRSWGGVLPLGRHVSISGSSLIQCASVSMAPPHPGWAKCYPGAKVQGRTGPRKDYEDRRCRQAWEQAKLDHARWEVCVSSSRENRWNNSHSSSLKLELRLKQYGEA